MEKENIIIFGQGDFSQLIYHYISNDNQYNIICFCVEELFYTTDKFCNLPVIKFEEIEKNYSIHDVKILLCIGYTNMRLRERIFYKIKEKQYKCINYISSKAIVDESVILGENNIILANVVIEPFVTIKDNNIIWSSTNISHNSKIASHCFIAAQSLIGGFSEVKNGCFIGFNATVVQNIIVEKECLLAAKTLVLHNTKEFTKYKGIPAKSVSTHFEEGIMIS